MTPNQKPLSAETYFTLGNEKNIVSHIVFTTKLPIQQLKI